jgi:hypothetical protein
LTDDQQAEFSTVYDANRGQSKGLAVATLEREWNRDGHRFWDDVATVEERVGGGSLMTVFRITLKAHDESGKPIVRVVKVLNPNLQFLLERTFSFLNELIDTLTKLFGRKFDIARLIVADVYEWIKGDVNFTGFLEKDARFKTQIESQNAGYKAAGFRYDLYVPRTYGPESKYFIHEEFVPGKTLTKWDELVAEGHDMQQVTSLLVKNYVSQLLTDNALVHSDVHIGNFMVTPDGRVAILDRNFFLELTPEMRDFVKFLLNPMSLRFSTPEVIVDRFVALGGREITPVQRRKLVASWTKARERVLAGDWQGLSGFLIDLRENGVKLPLQITLIFKNLNALQAMARKAGLGGLLGAYLFDPKKPPPAAPPARAPAEGSGASIRMNMPWHIFPGVVSMVLGAMQGWDVLSMAGAALTMAGAAWLTFAHRTAPHPAFRKRATAA